MRNQERIFFENPEKREKEIFLQKKWHDFTLRCRDFFIQGYEFALWIVFEI
jgi:hypothetical protein